MNRSLFEIRSICAAGIAAMLLSLAGCTQTGREAVQPPPPPPPQVFPPQKAMESGDYAGFLAENEKALKECQGKAEDPACPVALFNLGFLHAYSKSPYFNQSKALHYLEDLTKKYPRSPYAWEARAWTDLIEKSKVQEKRRRKLQSEIKTKDKTIDELNRQMQRAREIDEEIDRKERELLQ